ncbi:MAG TPA: SpoVG family protein [Candidatus Eisenbacteria bacterium]|jgi:stage V sporulation protein G|nr:SpoVG family protein [Candidatus Eisenbacteria bacterium]
MTVMDIEVVDIRKVNGENLKAFADLRLGGCAVIKGFSVMNGRNGLFVSMPRRQGKDGRWFEIFSPDNEEFKAVIQDKVMEAYDRETDGANS